MPASVTEPVSAIELERRGKLSLRLTVKVKDPAGTTRTVKRRVTPKLKRG